MIPYGRQDINASDRQAVLEVLKSDWLTQGPCVPKFEEAVARKVGAQYALAVNSATSALHIACLALGLGSGDWLWTSPNTFVASANCALYCGAQVDFVDIDPCTYNLCVESLKKKLILAKERNTLPKIVIPVHFAGQSCDMAAIHALSKEYGFKIIEDASHAIGGQYQDQWIGNCRYSDISVFSFHPVKIITTGEGGLALTNDPALAEAMQLLRSHGITRDPALMTRTPDGPWYYEQCALGFNYRMTDLQAALGLSQLERLEQFIAYRHQLVSFYNEAFQDLPLILPFQHPDTYSSWHLYVVQIDSTRTEISRNTLFNHLRESGIGVNVHYIPVHTQPYYQGLGFSSGTFPKAEAYYQHAITLPCFYGLSRQMQSQVIEQVRKKLI